jgi:hypothetical protein
MNSPDLAFRRLVEVIESLNIPFFVCGSVASSAHGVVRATLDVDLVAGVELRHIDDLVAALEKEFYIDADYDSPGAGRREIFHFHPLRYRV